MITKFVRKVINRYAQDDCSYMAASLAYYGLFSLFPLTLALVAILGYLLPISTLEEQILRFSEFYLPGSVDLVRANLAHLVIARQSVSMVALIGLLWAATSGVVALTKSLNRIWRAPTPRPFLLQRLLALGLVMAAGLLFLLSISGSAILRFASTIPAPGTDGDMLVDSLLWRITASLLPFVATFLTFLLLYWTIPNVRQRLAYLWPGALVASVGFEAAKSLFRFYVENLSRYQLLYGSLGTVIVLLLWIYLSAVILLFGAEFSVVFGAYRENEL